jgi:fructose-bisphosphate aldolase class II
MPLQSMVPMMKKAQAGGYAIGMFDMYTIEGFQAIIEAATEQNSPVMIAPFGMDRRILMAAIAEMAALAPIPVAVVLDHGRDFAQVMDSIHAGFTDVMIDASTLPYDGNVALTSKVAEAAHLAGLGVEAEIGHVGQGSDYADPSIRKAGLTSPDEAARFVAATGVDTLAVAIGSAHGQYVGTPELDFERLVEIKAAVSAPLVLHGGSGIADEDFRKAASLGICKVNIHTAMAMAATAAIAATIKEDEYTHYMKLTRVAAAAIKEVVVHHMQVFGSVGKAGVATAAAGSGMSEEKVE